MEFREKPMQNLIRIKEKEICKNVQALLLDGESIVGAYKTVRDQAVFTSHRIFIVDMQGVTGTIAAMPPVSLASPLRASHLSCVAGTSSKTSVVLPPDVYTDFTVNGCPPMLTMSPGCKSATFFTSLGLLLVVDFGQS